MLADDKEKFLPDNEKKHINKNYAVLLEDLKSRVDEEDLMSYESAAPEKIKIEDAIAEREKIKNIGIRQDIELKKATLKKLFLFLEIETAVVFLFSFFQAMHWPMNFGLEEWSFKLLIAATISQITAMLLIAVKHLFPNTK